MLCHGGASGAEPGCYLRPVASRAQLVHEGLQVSIFVVCPAAHSKYKVTLSVVALDVL